MADEYDHAGHSHFAPGRVPTCLSQFSCMAATYFSRMPVGTVSVSVPLFAFSHPWSPFIVAKRRIIWPCDDYLFNIESSYVCAKVRSEEAEYFLLRPITLALTSEMRLHSSMMAGQLFRCKQNHGLEHHGRHLSADPPMNCLPISSNCTHTSSPPLHTI